MTVADSEITLSDAIESPERTGAADDEGLASADRDRDRQRERWQQMIDRYLVEWGRDPNQLEDEDEGVVPPSKAIINRASQIAMNLRDAGWPGPLRVVPDGDGGISFERRTGAYFESLDILEDGSVELATFKDCRLQFRRRLA